MELFDDEFNFIIYDDKELVRHPFQYIIILSKLSYWSENIDALIEWCDMYNCVQEGLTVNVPDKETMVLFTLRWA